MPAPFDIDKKSRYFSALHRTLADPCGEPSLPRISSLRTLPEAQAYWETLDYLLRHLLGWSDVGTGLAWWYSSSFPEPDDPRFRLVGDFWNDEGQLSYFAAHHWRPGEPLIGTGEFSPTEVAKHAPYGSEDWWREFKRKGQQYPHDPFYGGTNPLHLEFSQTLSETQQPGAFQGYQSDPLHRRAVLVVSAFKAWIPELSAFGESLPKLQNRSWRVDAFDREVGFLGQFRRSRVTGRWFQGRHRFHVVGNELPTPG